MLLATVAGLTAAALSSTKGDARAAHPNSFEAKKADAEKTPQPGPQNIEDSGLWDGSTKSTLVASRSSERAAKSRRAPSRRVPHQGCKARSPRRGKAPLLEWRVIPNPSFQVDNEETQRGDISEERRIFFSDFLSSVEVPMLSKGEPE